MKRDLLARTKKLVDGLALREPLWLDAMQRAPPAVFPRISGKVKEITLPEDVYVNKFYQKHPDSKHEDPIKLNSFNPVPARIFASRVLELKEAGAREEEAIAVADMEYVAERKAKKQAYTRLRQISRVLGKQTPPNPYPSVVKEIQAEERPYVRERFFDPQILDMVKKIKEDKFIEIQEKFGGQLPKLGQGWQEKFSLPARQDRFGRPDRFGGPDRFSGPDRSDGPDRSGGPDRPGGPDRSGVVEQSRPRRQERQLTG